MPAEAMTGAGLSLEQSNEHIPQRPSWNKPAAEAASTSSSPPLASCGHGANEPAVQDVNDRPLALMTAA